MYGEEQLEMELERPDNPLLREREKTHGDYSKSAAISQNMKRTYRQGGSQLSLEMMESLDQICFKMARISCGDAFYIDHWRDIAGYATLVADLLEKAEGEKKKIEVEEI